MNNSVTKAIQLLEELSRVKQPLTLGDLARRTHLNKATAYRLLNALCQKGLAQKVGQLGVYALGAKLLALAEECKPMRERKAGVIINTSSNFGITGGAGRTAYAASKAAVIAFTKSLALEMAPHGVRVNTIAPGLTATARVMGRYDEAEWQRRAGQIPMGRAAHPSDIAEGVAFLASDDAGYITGQTLHVNGGMILN